MDQLIPQRFTNFTSSVHTQTVSASYITLSFAALEDQAHGSYAFPLCPPCVPITVGPWTWRGEHIDYLFHRLSTNSTPAALPFPECSCFIHFCFCFVELAHCRYSGNDCSIPVLMNTSVRTPWRLRGVQEEVLQLVRNECTLSYRLHLAVKWTSRAFADLDFCSSALIVSSRCLALCTFLDINTLTEYQEDMLSFSEGIFISVDSSLLL